jgi:MFS family permease
VWPLYVVAALSSALVSVQRPALDALLPRIVAHDHLPAAGSLNALRWQVGGVAGPALAGVVVAYAGLGWAYGADLLTFAVSVLFMVGLTPSPASHEAAKPSLKAIVEGARYAWGRKELLGTYVIDIAAMFFAMPQALYPALAVIYGDKYVGFFPASIAAGALIASLTSGWTKNVHRHGLMVTVAAVFWGVAITIFGLVNTIFLALLFLGAAGFFDMISGIFRGAIWNQTIPNYLRGRLASIEMMSYLTGPMLGSAKMGIVAENFGVRTALVSGGILCVAAVGLAALFLPKFAAYDGRQGVKQKEREEAERAELSRVSESEF